MSDDPVMGDLSSRCTASGRPPVNPDSASVPNSEKLPDGQYRDHWVLCEAERAKGYVRPVRDNYVHVGPPGPKFELRDLTAEERERFADCDYVRYEKYPPGHHGSALGRFWTQAQLDRAGKGCGTQTFMPSDCAKTYARDPHYYGSTFCCGCGEYFPVGRDGEFFWTGTTERVGT